MYLKFTILEDTLVVYLMGELDHHSAEEVRIRIDDRIDREKLNNLILDFSGVTFMDSSGIGVVIGRYKKIQREKGNILITGALGSVKRVFELSGIFKIIDFYEEIDEALENI